MEPVSGCGRGRACGKLPSPYYRAKITRFFVWTGSDPRLQEFGSETMQITKPGSPAPWTAATCFFF